MDAAQTHLTFFLFRDITLPLSLLMYELAGYFNYHYFCNFLWFVELAMIYGASMMYVPFTKISGPLYKHQLQEFQTLASSILRW
jgi:hypothetical protein